MHPRARLTTLLLVLGGLSGALAWLVRHDTTSSAEPKIPDDPARIELVPVAAGFEQPTDLQFVPGTGQAVVLQKTGAARLGRLAKPGEPASTEFATLFERKVRTGSELGLLGLAFHPRFHENGLVYVNYDPAEGPLRTRISELRLTLGSNAADGAPLAPSNDERVLLEIDQPFENHDGGQVAFGPDGKLYLALGDGGSGGDPQGHGQRLDSLLGKILRIDVDARDGDRPYAVPKDNPFVGKPGARPEIYAYGLRNPWRFTFAPDGRLIVADVGQNTWEEIDLVRAGDNLGWNVREGKHCFAPPAGCKTEGLVDPIFEYGHDLGHSVTGGVVVTGKAAPRLAGRYVFADFVDGRFFALTLPDGKAERLGKLPIMPSTFGRDAEGNAYVADFGRGVIHAIVTH